MGADGAANIIFKREIDAAQNPEEVRAQKNEEYREAFATPYAAADRGLVDRVILPEETRKELFIALSGTESKRESLPRKKHGVIPH
jgi:acetyl-CoA carboxylase carboxyltransferase component